MRIRGLTLPIQFSVFVNRWIGMSVNQVIGNPVIGPDYRLPPITDYQPITDYPITDIA
jgi:hypothetical protein